MRPTTQENPENQENQELSALNQELNKVRLELSRIDMKNQLDEREFRYQMLTILEGVRIQLNSIAQQIYDNNQIISEK